MEISYLKSRKGILATSIVLLCIIGFIVTGLLSRHSKEDVREKVQQAFEKQDVDVFLSVLPKDAQSSPFARDGIKSFLKESSEYKQMYPLMVDAMDIEKTNVAPKALEARTKGVLPYTIVKEGKSWLFFDNYVVRPAKAKINLKNIDKDVALSLNGKKITPSDFDKPFLPGNYELVGVKKYKWTTVTDKTTIHVGGNDPVENVSLSLKGNELDLSKEFIGSEIMFKGQATGIKVGDEESKKFGPINKKDEKEIQLKANFPWAKDGISKINDDQKTSLLKKEGKYIFKVDEDKANQFFHLFLKEYGDASIKQSIEPFTTITEKYKNSKAESFASAARDTIIKPWKGTLVKSYLNKEVVKIVSNEKGYPILEMEGHAKYHIPAGEYSPEKDQFRNVQIKALYDTDQKAWKINEASVDSSFAAEIDKNEEEKYIITSVQ
ncbi:MULTISPECIES: hypothetical protein [Bacillus cereus group]|uniref:YvbJ-like NTF2-like domain-containing protein n=1 Tax=Bacillus cereus TaxID=1396 RepID=A0AA44Q5P7_BACCE|nr:MULTISPECIES: hypothetical protein [Bacillus cereus group]PFN09243.1 hypothetical protein COJ55_03510 [Bacillus cereus]PFR86380.1 hypothetical protein COK38_26420 [Bacillus cereus]